MGTGPKDKSFGTNLPVDLFDELDQFVEQHPRLRKKDIVIAAIWMYLRADTADQNDALQAIQQKYYSVSISEPDAAAKKMDDRLGRASQGSRRGRKGTA